MKRVSLIALAWILLLGLAPAQESAPASDAGELKRVMLELQKGTWTLDSARTVIEALIKGNHPAAAAWWLEMADEAVKSKLLPANAQTTLAPLRKQCAEEGASADDRKLALKVFRHLESVLASKNFDEARKVLAVSKVASALAPDAATARSLEAAEKKVTGAGNQDPSNLPRQQKQFGDMQEAILAMMRTRLDVLFSDYEFGGCRVGRIAQETILKGASGALGEEDANNRIRKLRNAAHGVEPTHALSLLIRPISDVRVFQDGVEIRSPIEPGLSIQVLEGDLIQVEIPRYSALLEDGKRSLHVAAVSARLDGKYIGAKNWWLSASSDPTALEPALSKIELVRVGPNDELLKTKFPNSLKHFEKHGAFIVGCPGGPLAYEVLDYSVEFEKEFIEQKLKYAWLGAIRETAVLVLKIPGG